MSIDVHHSATDSLEPIGPRLEDGRFTSRDIVPGSPEETIHQFDRPLDEVADHLRTPDDASSIDPTTPEHRVSYTELPKNPEQSRSLSKKTIALVSGLSLTAAIVGGAVVKGFGGGNDDTSSKPRGVVTAPVTPGESASPTTAPEVKSSDLADNPDLWVYPGLGEGAPGVTGKKALVDMLEINKGQFPDRTTALIQLIAGEQGVAANVRYFLNTCALTNPATMMPQLREGIVQEYRAQCEEAFLDSMFVDDQKDGKFATFLKSWFKEQTSAPNQPAVSTSGFLSSLDEGELKFGSQGQIVSGKVNLTKDGNRYDFNVTLSQVEQSDGKTPWLITDSSQ